MAISQDIPEAWKANFWKAMEELDIELGLAPYRVSVMLGEYELMTTLIKARDEKDAMELAKKEPVTVRSDLPIAYWARKAEITVSDA